MFHDQRESTAMAQSPAIYETAFIVNAGLDDPQIDAVIEKVKESIAKHGGSVLDINKWGRKRFTYPIRKKNNGFYVIAEFTGPSDLVAKLERHYQLDENILRYLTIRLDKHALKARAQKATADAAAQAAVPEPAPAA
ncbi:MAG: 30S ribosomal protein S6 [Bacteroidetes bacterium]|jgi:small subunit ribosomal protein S6|nr:30S ribosomal protein S6 [Bacteroidota bacterium]